jgi:hypothetical protein
LGSAYHIAVSKVSEPSKYRSLRQCFAHFGTVKPLFWDRAFAREKSGLFRRRGRRLRDFPPLSFRRYDDLGDVIYFRQRTNAEHRGDGSHFFNSAGGETDGKKRVQAFETQPQIGCGERVHTKPRLTAQLR